MSDLNRILTDQLTAIRAQLEQVTERATWHETQRQMFAEQRDKLAQDAASLEALLGQTKPTELEAMIALPEPSGYLPTGSVLDG